MNAGESGLINRFCNESKVGHMQYGAIKWNGAMWLRKRGWRKRDEAELHLVSILID
jgi:hypothetical protein